MSQTRRILHFIPGAAVSYWVSPKLFDTFVSYTPLGDIAEPRQGLTTCDNDRFMRFWHEVELNNIGFNCSSTKESEALPQKWYPYNKGGEPRKWYGNNEYVVNWHNDGSEVKAFVASKYVSYTRTVKNIPYYFKKDLHGLQSQRNMLFVHTMKDLFLQTRDKLFLQMKASITIYAV